MSWHTRLSLSSARAVLLPSLALFLCTPYLGAQSFGMLSGNGQIVIEEFASSLPMVVQAKDASGHPLAGVAVSWTITQGMGTISNPMLTTDSNGMASAGFTATRNQPGISFLASTVTATSALGHVDFIVTTTPFNGTFVQ